ACAQTSVRKGGCVRANDAEVVSVETRAHLRERLVGNRYAELALRLGEREPEPSPQTMPRGGRPKLEHRGGCVALSERRRISIGRCHRMPKSVQLTCP